MGFLIPRSWVRPPPGVLKSTGKPVLFSFQARGSFVEPASILKNPQISTGRRGPGGGVGQVSGTRVIGGWVPGSPAGPASAPPAGKKSPAGGVSPSRTELRISTQFHFESAVRCRRGPFQRADRHGRVDRVKQAIQRCPARLHATCHRHLRETESLHRRGDLVNDDPLRRRRYRGFQRPARSPPRLMRLGRMSWPAGDHSRGPGLRRGASARTSPRSSAGTVLVPTQSTRRRS